jgi:hypothetical protein
MEVEAVRPVLHTAEAAEATLAVEAAVIPAVEVGAEAIRAAEVEAVTLVVEAITNKLL